MARQIITIAITITTVLLAGCVDRAGETQGASGLFGALMVPSGGTQRELHTESYAAAFGQARAVMSQYFTVTSADQDTGLIECLPARLESTGSDRVVGRSPARQVATMKIRRHGSGRITATCWVQVQRQSSTILRQQSIMDETYDSVPHHTPAEIDAATTPDQNDAWETFSSDQPLENQILNDLARTLDGASS